MLQGWNPWLLGAGLAVGVFLLLPRKSAERPTGYLPPSDLDADLDALASMLITETAFAKSKAEMAQIVFVALNRSRGWGVPIRTVVAGPPPRGHIGWNNSDTYKSRFAAAPNKPRWAEAREFARQIVSGADSYRNLGLRMFVHPGGMSTPPCVGTPKAPRVATSTIAGVRCLPPWAVGGRVVGSAMFA